MIKSREWLLVLLVLVSITISTTTVLGNSIYI